MKEEFKKENNEMKNEFKKENDELKDLIRQLIKKE